MKKTKLDRFCTHFPFQVPTQGGLLLVLDRFNARSFTNRSSIRLSLFYNGANDAVFNLLLFWPVLEFGHRKEKSLAQRDRRP